MFIFLYHVLTYFLRFTMLFMGESLQWLVLYRGIDVFQSLTFSSPRLQIKRRRRRALPSSISSSASPTSIPRMPCSSSSRSPPLLAKILQRNAILDSSVILCSLCVNECWNNITWMYIYKNNVCISEFYVAVGWKL